MQSIGDIMQEMQITTHHQPAVAQRSELVERLKARLQEYSCSQLNEEDYAETTNPWDEWPYSWACRLHAVARERLHSFHQNRNDICGEVSEDATQEYSEYDQVAARAA